MLRQLVLLGPLLTIPFRAAPGLAPGLPNAVVLTYASAIPLARTPFDYTHAFPNSSTTHRNPHRTPRNASWGCRHRSLLLVAREGESPGRAVPGGGKRLHRGHDRQFEALQPRHLAGDAGAYQADRSLRPHPPRRVLLLLADRRRQAIPHTMPPQGQYGSPRGSSARPQRPRQGPEIRRPRRLRGL